MTYYIYNFVQFVFGSDLQENFQYGGADLKVKGWQKILKAADEGNIKELNKLWKTENDSFGALQYVVAHGKHGEPLAIIAIGNNDLDLYKWTYEDNKLELLTHDTYEEILVARELERDVILDWIDENVDSLDNYD